MAESKEHVEATIAITVVIADPLRIVREGLLALLATRREVIVVGQAGSATELAAMAAGLHPQVVVTESWFPDCEGRHALRVLREGWPDAAILLLTGESRQERIFEALEAGAIGYLHKDCRPGELVRAILAVARGELFLPAPIGKALVAHLAGSDRNFRDQAAAPILDLTPREREILDFLMDGLGNKEIAQRLYISVRTVEMHLSNIYGKLGVSSRLEAAAVVARARR